jgi:hypothetical protein
MAARLKCTFFNSMSVYKDSAAALDRVHTSSDHHAAPLRELREVTDQLRDREQHGR